jgi:AmmeMemoRadiSam system protein B
MATIRTASFAGSWYPASAAACEKEIKNFLKEPGFAEIPTTDYVGGIVPHAGWYFSGSLACRVIAGLRGPDTRPEPDVIVVFGMHMHPSSAPVIMTCGAWETPFGEIEIAAGLAESLTTQFSVHAETPDHFTPENTIELQLPFIKYFFKAARLLPIGVPPAGVALDIARSISETARQSNLSIKIVGSTDLTHYGPNYGFTPLGSGKKAVDWARDENDKNAIDRMLTMDPEGLIADSLSSGNACCSGAAAAAIAAAINLGATRGRLVGYRSSYDKHPGDSFVGYAGVLFS